MEIKEAIEHILDGNALLFVGAGFSMGATGKSGQSLPVGSTLKIILGDAMGVADTSSHSLSTVAAHYTKRNSEFALVKMLKELYTVNAALPHHVHISGLQWKAIYTTNFDDLIELSHINCGKRISSYDKDDPIPVGTSKKFCMHVNGYIGKEYCESNGTRLTLTTAEYAANELNNSPWGTRLRDDFALAKAVIFIGYSLYDIDIERMLFDAPSLKVKTIFINGDSNDEMSNERLAEYGLNTGLTANAFSELIKNCTKDYTSKTITSPSYFSLSKYAPNGVADQNVSKMLYDLLVFGLVSESKVRHSILDQTNDYYVRRKEIDVVASIIEKNAKNIIIHSDIGNGKSLLLEGIKARASNVMDVYTVTRKDYFNVEFESLASSYHGTRKVLICIDGYGRYIDELKFIQRFRNANIILLLAEKSALHDVLERNALSSIGAVDTYIYDVNTLDQEELKLVLNLISSAGYWGESYRSSEELMELLRNNWNCSFRNILLDVFNSPNIAKKISDAIALIPGNYKTTFYAALILSILNSSSQVEPFTINDLTGTYEANSILFSSNQYVRSLIAFHGNEIFVSSILASHILTSFGDSREIINTAVLITKRSHDNLYYKNIFREMMRFGNLQRLLPLQNKLSSIELYYENIRNLDNARNNPYFWLQYAMGCLACKDFTRSERLFDTAYSMGKRGISFDTYQIDNHYARLLLSCTTLSKYPAPMDRFNRAREIIFSQLSDGDSPQFQYSCRSAGTILQFFNEFYSEFSKADLGRIQSTCLRIITLLEKAQIVRHSKELQECKKRLSTVVKDIKNRTSPPSS